MKRSSLISILLIVSALFASCSVPALPIQTDFIDTGINPDSWVTIPSGTFLSGQHSLPLSVDYDYQIMSTLVTNQQFAAYLNQALASASIEKVGNEIQGYYPGEPFDAKKHEEQIQAGNWLHLVVNEEGSHLFFDGSTFSSMPGYENHPVTFITWFGAQGYCQSVGGRLPSEIEWEKAARGDQDDRAYPWGNTIARNQANYYNSKDTFEKIVGKGGDTTPVGFYNGQTYGTYQTLESASPYGLYDMAGNVWQWMNDDYPGIHYKYLRGGSKIDYAYNLRVWSRNNVRPDYTSPNIGFRCVRLTP